MGFLFTVPQCKSSQTVEKTESDDLSTYEGRRIWLLKNLKDFELTDRGKQDLPKACARLWNNPNDTVALNYITNVLDHRHQSMFDFPGIALLWGCSGKVSVRISLTPSGLILRSAQNLTKKGRKDFWAMVLKTTP